LARPPPLGTASGCCSHQQPAPPSPLSLHPSIQEQDKSAASVNKGPIADNTAPNRANAKRVKAQSVKGNSANAARALSTNAARQLASSTRTAPPPRSVAAQVQAPATAVRSMRPLATAAEWQQAAAAINNLHHPPSPLSLHLFNSGPGAGSVSGPCLPSPAAPVPSA
jgi:hypothetical protein